MESKRTDYDLFFEEAHTQKLALERSTETYLLIDSSKIGKEDFTSICPLLILKLLSQTRCLKMLKKNLRFIPRLFLVYFKWMKKLSESSFRAFCLF